jgi:hypothetical protein
MGPMNPTQATASIPINYCLILTRAHTGQLIRDPACFGYTIGSPDAALSFDERDSAPFVRKCVIVDPNFDWRGQPRSRGIPWDRTIVYEMHVKGFTQQHPGVGVKQCGTFAGLKGEVIEYIKSLGVTSSPNHRNRGMARLFCRSRLRFRVWRADCQKLLSPEVPCGR